MTLDQFRTKWGGVLGSLLICELLNRIDQNINTPMHHACRELADDLQKLLADTPAPVAGTVEFHRRERAKLAPGGEGERQ